MQFNVGDRVRFKEGIGPVRFEGKTLTVGHIDDLGYIWSADFYGGWGAQYFEPIAKQQQEPTARAILDLDRKPLTDKQQAAADGIARAVEAMTHNSLIGSYRRGEW